jgi:GDP-mannose 6-dehydrogenase
MGYVGVVSAACLLRDGHHVCGIDTTESKVQDLNKGRSPILELHVPEYLSDGHSAGRLSASIDPVVGVENAEMIWICVGTPSDPDGGINLQHVETVLQQIGDAMVRSDNYPLIVLRSTTLPGTSKDLAIPIIERATGKKVGKDLHMVFHPEFLREGNAMADFDAPPKIVVGESTAGAADRLLEIYEKYPGPRFRLTLSEAEMVKYCDNLFHALKLTFANEVAAIAKSVDVDSRKVAEVYCADKKLNISEKYLQPGFAYGGSCLPKDLRAILRFASVNALNLPMLQGVQESNSIQINRFIGRVRSHEPNKVGIVGIAFKPGTDDMRESPYVKVAKALIGEGVNLAVYDPSVHPDQLIGANREQVVTALKHLEDMMVRSATELDDCDVIIVNHNTISSEQINKWLSSGTLVMDVANIKNIDHAHAGYEGIYW